MSIEPSSLTGDMRADFGQDFETVDIGFGRPLETDSTGNSGDQYTKAYTQVKTI